jgi:lycopene cyclase domain-containing protein
MPIYPAAAIAAAVLVVALELRVLRTGIFRDRAYWITLGICLAFMIPVDGWLTKHSAPIVIYRASDTSDTYPIWNILAEEYVYAFALLTLVMACWDWLGRRESASADPAAHHDEVTA